MNFRRWVKLYADINKDPRFLRGDTSTRTTFLQLMPELDDDGRYRAVPSATLVETVALQISLPEAEVESALAKAAELQLIRISRDDRGEYLTMPGFVARQGVKVSGQGTRGGASDAERSKAYRQRKREITVTDRHGPSRDANRDASRDGNCDASRIVTGDDSDSDAENTPDSEIVTDRHGLRARVEENRIEEKREETPIPPSPVTEEHPPEGTPPASPVEPDWNQVQREVDRKRFEDDAWEVFGPQSPKSDPSVPQELVLEPPAQPDLPSVPDAEQEVFDHWREVTGHTDAKFSAGRRKKIRERLKEGFTLEQLLDAVDGVKKSPYHQGANEHRKKYDELTLICRDAEHVERFRGYYLDSLPKVPTVDPIVLRAREAMAQGKLNDEKNKLRLVGGNNAK